MAWAGSRSCFSGFLITRVVDNSCWGSFGCFDWVMGFLGRMASDSFFLARLFSSNWNSFTARTIFFFMFSFLSLFPGVVSPSKAYDTRFTIEVDRCCSSCAVRNTNGIYSFFLNTYLALIYGKLAPYLPSGYNYLGYPLSIDVLLECLSTLIEWLRSTGSDPRVYSSSDVIELWWSRLRERVFDWEVTVCWWEERGCFVLRDAWFTLT